MSLDNWEIIKRMPERYGEECYQVKCQAHIKLVETGEVRVYDTEEYIYEGSDNEWSASVFNWEENNYSCDCNREIFFNRAHGRELTDEEWDMPCTDGRYEVNLVNCKNGEVYYREFS